LIERLWLRHHSKIELTLQQHIGKPGRHAFHDHDFATAIGGVKARQKAHEARWADGAHDAETDLRVLQAEKTFCGGLRGLGIRRQLAQMRLDKPAEIGQMRELPLAPQQQPPSSSSSCWIALVSAGCETLHSSAARVKFNVSASARK